MAVVEFWVSIGSTYSYLSVMRLGRVEAETGAEFDIRPFSVRAIMLEMNNIPFAGKPAKLAYMWRDVGRRAALRGLSPRLPAPYPLEEFDLANRVAVVGRREGWLRVYLAATYRRWFEAGEAAGSEPNLSASLREIGEAPVRVIALAKGDEIGAAYEAATAEAAGKGVFGSPSFIVGEELFWGDDRMEDAVAWARDRRLGA